MSRRFLLWIVIAALAAAAAGFFLGRRQAPPEPETPPVAAAPEPAPAPAPAASEPAIQYPVPPASAPLPGLAQSDAAITEALVGLLGKPRVLALLQTDGFIRRVVATVDALPSTHAAPRLWPVNPTAGRFTTGGDGSETRIATANAARYDAFVAAAEAVDIPQAVAVYLRFYPLFQQAYADLGYPKGWFNDRLVQVIDHLIAAPEPASPPLVRLTEVKGPVASTRPWVHYEYVDPALESASAGQKLLIRLGLTHERRLKTRLVELRRALTEASQR